MMKNDVGRAVQHEFSSAALDVGIIGHLFCFFVEFFSSSGLQGGGVGGGPGCGYLKIET